MTMDYLNCDSDMIPSGVHDHEKKFFFKSEIIHLR